MKGVFQTIINKGNELCNRFDRLPSELYVIAVIDGKTYFIKTVETDLPCTLRLVLKEDEDSLQKGLFNNVTSTISL